MYFCVQIERNMTEGGKKYRLNSMEEPTDEVLSQLMKEAAEEAKRTNEEATRNFFERLRRDARKVTLLW